jgi:hypothetical protein
MYQQTNGPKGPGPEYNEYSQILLKLIHLRQTDYDRFMDELYVAVTGHFRSVIHDKTPVEEKLQAIDTMIKHFIKSGEQYEKCADLQKLRAELTDQLKAKELVHA